MPLAITGHNLHSSIGHDIETSIASYRAGIVRPILLPNFQVLDMEDLDTISILGYPITGLTDGFHGAGLFIRLSVLVINELIQNLKFVRSDNNFFHETGFNVCLPKCRDENFDFYNEVLKQTFIQSVCENLNIKFNETHQQVFFDGNAGVLIAAQKAAEIINKRVVKRVIILAVDSLVGKADLEYFAQSNRLKTLKSPIGLIPGEAGAAILLEDATSARKRNAPILGYIDAINTGIEKNNLESEQKNFGDGLSDVLNRTLAGRDRISCIYGDLNGEDWRAHEYGSALVKLTGKYNIENISSHFPAECFGDTGAASGALSICAAIQSFNRNYASSDEIVVFSSSDTGEVASALLLKATN
jgi:3-oxoacyl-[acyl-carrier-protein] synthase-1